MIPGEELNLEFQFRMSPPGSKFGHLNKRIRCSADTAKGMFRGLTCCGYASNAAKVRAQSGNSNAGDSRSSKHFLRDSVVTLGVCSMTRRLPACASPAPSAKHPARAPIGTIVWAAGTTMPKNPRQPQNREGHPCCDRKSRMADRSARQAQLPGPRPIAEAS